MDFNEHRVFKQWRFWIGSLLSVVCLVWLVVNTEWAEARRAFENADSNLIVAAIGTNLLSIPMRALRWQLLFLPRTPPRFAQLATVMLIGQAINTLAPARLGDLIRATLVARQSTGFVLGTITLQLAVDLLITVALALLVLPHIMLPEWWQTPWQTMFAALLSVLVLLGITTLLRHRAITLLQELSDVWTSPTIKRITRSLIELLHSFDVTTRPWTITGVLLLSIGIWLLYGVTNYLVLLALGMPSPWLAAFLTLVVLQIGVAVPSSPGRIGVYHYLAVQTLALLAVEQGIAVSFAVILHLISVMLPIFLALIPGLWMGLRPDEGNLTHNSGRHL